MASNFFFPAKGRKGILRLKVTKDPEIWVQITWYLFIEMLPTLQFSPTGSESKLAALKLSFQDLLTLVAC